MVSAQTAPLHGQLEADSYASPTGEFSMTVPVLVELGGVISDTPQVVTFRDAFNLHASVACFRMDATQRWENETRGRREYLVWFFSEFVQSDFRARFPGAAVESARFMPELLGGSLVVFNLLPGGTMFGDRVPSMSNGELPVAKRGNLMFVHNSHLYVVSTELAEKVLQPRTFSLTEEEQNTLLRERLLKLIGRMAFRVSLPITEQLGAVP